MYLEEFLKQFDDKKIELYVDMDGVIADYDIGKSADFENKRPLFTSIQKLEKISKKDNVVMNILSITKTDEGVSQKQKWLDKYAPFFKRENRNIISKESNIGLKSYELKANFFNNIERNPGKVIVFIDDDPLIIKSVKKNHPDVVLLKDSVLVD